MRFLRSYVARRLWGALLTLLGVAVGVFIVLRLVPGDAISASMGTETAILTPLQRRALEDYYGIGQPLVQQFGSWLGNVVRGNLGVSTQSGEAVTTLVARSLPVTLELAVLSTLIGTTVGVGVGVFSAARPDRLRSGVGQVLSLLSLITPTFVIATAFVTIFAARFAYMPNAAGFAGLFDDPWLNLQQMLFPALTLGFALSGTVIRTTRSAYLEASEQEFVRFARSKGVSERRVKWRHVLPNALIPIVTITGIQFGYLLGGTVVVEQVFSLPGLGRLVLTGINQREYALVQSTVLIIAVGFVLVNLLVDLLYARIDPRVKLR
jgi:peptide/nickel transport system permease protein